MCAAPVAQFVVFPVVSQRSTRLGLVVAELILLWVAALAVRRRRWIPEDLFLLNAVPATALAAAVPAAVGAALVVGELDGWLSRLLALMGWGPPLSLQQFQLRVQVVTDAADAAGVLAAVVLVPAVCEEAFFRGFVFTGLRYHYGSVTALVGSALIFGAVHFNPWQFPALVLLGLVLGALVNWTHSLYPALLAHALNNLLSVLAVNLRAHVGRDYLGAGEPLSLPLLAAAGVALWMGLRLVRRSGPLMPLLSPHSRPAPAEEIPAAPAWR